MTDSKEINLLTQQLRAVLLNKPVAPQCRVQSEDLQELQGAVDYISESLKEVQDFLIALCEGRLNVAPPGRHNFVASYLKELHSILKHLTWQTEQVANGDYSQRVRFLGEFSDSFNILTAQLREREESIQAKTDALTKSINLLKIVLDAQQDWVVVTDVEQHHVIYSNASAKRNFFNPDTERCFHKSHQDLLDKLLHTSDNGNSEEDTTFTAADATIFSLRSFPMEWEGRKSFVHCIGDVTDAMVEMELLQDMAFKDSLTVAYNRRYCMQRIEQFLKQKKAFSLVLIDLDGLKLVNDVLGHLHGDDYIMLVADNIVAALRPKDRFCRMGGDEFILLMPDCGAAAARNRLAYICDLLAKVERPYSIAISYGVVYVSGEEIMPLEDILCRADENMYIMKQKHKVASAALLCDPPS